MERVTDEALMLSAVDHGESDRVVTFLTRSHGRLAAFAAGARRSRKRFSGALEPFMLLSIGWTERRGGTARLETTDIRRGFYPIREDLPRIARALYCMELLRELTRDGQPHPELFDAAVSWLDAQERGVAGPTSLLAFELDALEQVGLMPRFDACALCGREDGRTHFEPSHGGRICDSCLPRAPAAIPVPEELLAQLTAMQAGARNPLSPEARARARALLNLFVEHHLGRRLRSVDFMAQLGVD